MLQIILHSVYRHSHALEIPQTCKQFSCLILRNVYTAASHILRQQQEQLPLGVGGQKPNLIWNTNISLYHTFPHRWSSLEVMTDGKAEAQTHKYVQMHKSVLLHYLVEILVNVWPHELVKFHF